MPLCTIGAVACFLAQVWTIEESAYVENNPSHPVTELRSTLSVVPENGGNLYFSRFTRGKVV